MTNDRRLNLRETGAKDAAQEVGVLTMGGNIVGGVGVPSRLIAFWTFSTPPAGWVEYAAARGRFIVGVPSGGTIAGTVGTALTNLQDKTHTHTGPSHTHTGPSHTHTGPNHTHTGPSHTHNQNSAGANTANADASLYPPVRAASEFNSQMELNQPTGAATNYLLRSGVQAGGTGATGAEGTGATGAAGTGATGAEGAGATGSAATSNVAPYIQLFTIQKS